MGCDGVVNEGGTGGSGSGSMSEQSCIGQGSVTENRIHSS